MQGAFFNFDYNPLISIVVGGTGWEVMLSVNSLWHARQKLTKSLGVQNTKIPVQNTNGKLIKTHDIVISEGWCIKLIKK